MKRLKIDSNRLWWSAFSGGTILICAAAWVPVPYFYFIGLVFPLAVMVGYAYLGWKHTVGTEEQAQFADSVYYLGFLFTLVTLALALIFLATSADWGRVPLEELIGRFGLALATTIIGLSIRVAWVNAMSGRSNARENSEQALAVAAENFRIQLEESSEAFKTLSSTYLDELQRACAVSSQTFQRHAEASGQTLNGVLERVSNAVDSSVSAYTNRFTETMSKFALPDEWIKEAISEPTRAIANSLDFVFGEIENVVESQRRLSGESENVAEKFKGIANSLAPLARISEKVGGVAESLENTSRTMVQFVQSFEKQISGSEERMDRLSAAIGRLESSVSSLSTGMIAAGKSSKSLSEISEVARIHKNELESNLAASRKAVSSLHDELLMAAKSVSKTLGDD